MNGVHHPPARRGGYSLKAIIRDVEQREGRSFSGPETGKGHPDTRAGSRPPPPRGSYSLSKIIQEVAEREGCPVEPPEAVAIRHEGPRHPRATRQLTLEGGRMAPVVTPLDRFTIIGAGRASGNRSAPFRAEHPSPREQVKLAGPEESTPPPIIAASNVGAVLSLLPQIPAMPDEAFLLLYLNASREFERRFGAPGWSDRVLTMAARGR